MPLSEGTRLGPYEIVAPLGQGGMGEVYRAKAHPERRIGGEDLGQDLDGDGPIEPRIARAVDLAHPLAPIPAVIS